LVVFELVLLQGQIFAQLSVGSVDLFFSKVTFHVG